jgi:hypothetical protein
MGEWEDPMVNDLAENLSQPDIVAEDATTASRGRTWLRYSYGALAGGLSAFFSGLIVVFIWDIVMVLIEFSGFELLWQWRFVLFFYYQKVPLEYFTASEEMGSSTETYLCVLTVAGIILFAMMFLSGRIAVKISRPKTTMGAILSGAVICLPYTAACLVLYPFARYSRSAYEIDITKPVLPAVIILCFFWSFLFGAWGGMRQFSGRAPLRKWLEDLASDSSERVISLVKGSRNTVRILLLASIVGLVFFFVIAFKSGVPDRHDIPYLVNEAPGMSAIAFSSAMGVPVEEDEYEWLYGSPFEYMDNNLAYGNLGGSTELEGIQKVFMDLFFLLGTLAIFIYGSWLLIRRRCSTRISAFILSLLSYSILFPFCLLFLSSGDPQYIGQYIGDVHINRELLLLYGFAWPMVIGLIAFGLHLGYMKWPTFARQSR